MIYAIHLAIELIICAFVSQTQNTKSILRNEEVLHLHNLSLFSTFVFVHVCVCKDV